MGADLYFELASRTNQATVEAVKSNCLGGGKRGTAEPVSVQGCASVQNAGST